MFDLFLWFLLALAIMSLLGGIILNKPDMNQEVCKTELVKDCVDQGKGISKCKYAKEIDIPADLKDKAEEARADLIEAVAEFDDDMMMTYLDGGEVGIGIFLLLDHAHVGDADLLQDAQSDSHLFLGGRSQGQTGMAQLDAGDGFDSGTQDGVGQDTAVLTGGLAETVDGNEQVLCLLVVTLCECLEDSADLVTENISFLSRGRTVCVIFDEISAGI